MRRNKVGNKPAAMIMPARQRLLVGLCLLLAACGERTVDDALTSDELVRWKREQEISYDMFLGSGPDNAYSAYVGFYFIWDFQDAPDIRFNVTTFLDRTKSYASEINERTDSTKHAMYPILYKLKFDHFEIYARKLRRYLLENREKFEPNSDELVKSLSSKYFNQADSAWARVMDEIKRENDYTEEHVRYLRKMIDIDLEAYKDFDDSKNNFNQDSVR